MSNPASRPIERPFAWIVLISLLVGHGVGGLAIAAFGLPPRSPGVPPWVFPAVWTLLFPCFGLATALVARAPRAGRSRALRAGAIAAAVLLAWVPIVSATGEPWAAVALDLIAWCTVWYAVVVYRRTSRAAARWMFPVALWIPLTTLISIATAVVA